MVQTFGEFEFDDVRKTLKLRGSDLRLSGQALELLCLLLARPGELVTREEIHSRLWPDVNVGFEHSMDVVVSRLRTMLPDYIQTVPRRGYRFTEPVIVRTGWIKKTIRYAAVAVLAAVAAVLFARSRYDKVVKAHAPRTTAAASDAARK